MMRDIDQASSLHAAEIKGEKKAAAEIARKLRTLGVAIETICESTGMKKDDLDES